MIVIDASALVELLLQRPGAQQIEEYLAPDEVLHAPHLIDIEIAHVVRRLCASGEAKAERGALALQRLGAFPLRRYSHHILLPRIWALRANLTAYDAAYAALAEALDADLLTRDHRLASASGHKARVILV